MRYCDSHVHSQNSHDGRVSLAKDVAVAKEKGLEYLSITDHCDYDFEYGKCTAPVKWNFLDLDKYYADYLSTKKELDADKNNTLTFCFGIEAAYCDKEICFEKYKEIESKYPFDVVINSVHCVNGQDVYFKKAFLFKPKKKVYGDYLDTILKSLDAPYQYDIVAHIGYIAHGAPYRDRFLRYADFPDKIDAILKGIIERNKALEVNFHHEMNPPRDIIERYYELGGRKISYGSDAHRGDLCKEYESVSNMLLEIGFTHYSVFVRHEERLIPIEK